MSWTTPRTWVAAEVLTAANFNTHIRDNLDAAAGANKAACRIFNAGNISIATSGVTQLVTFDSERFDRQGLHSTSVNTGRITIPAGWGGIWDIGASMSFAANATGYRQLFIRLNGSAVLPAQVVQPALAGVEIDLNINTLYAAVAGDFFDFLVGQTSGGALNLTGSTTQTNYGIEAWGKWVGA